MMVDIYNISGQIVRKLKLPELFTKEVKPELLAQSVRVFLSNQRTAAAKTKTRSFVVGSTHKIYKQKGTGKARHGAKKAPIFVGGGVAHGPTGQENYSLRLPKKARRLAMFGSLANQLKEKKIVFVEGLVKIKPKTQTLVQVFTKIGLSVKNQHLDKNTLLVLPNLEKNLTLASRNIADLDLIPAKLLNAYQILRAQKIIMPIESLTVITDTFQPEPKKTKLTKDQ
jgi:large subunit ribosomal protein L4